MHSLPLDFPISRLLSVFKSQTLCNQVTRKWNPPTLPDLKASLVAQMVKRLPVIQESWVWSLGWEDPLEKAMATHSSTLAWKIPWVEEPGGLQFMGSQRVGHDWATSHYLTALCFPSSPSKRGGLSPRTQVPTSLCSHSHPWSFKSPSLQGCSSLPHPQHRSTVPCSKTWRPGELWNSEYFSFSGPISRLFGTQQNSQWDPASTLHADSFIFQQMCECSYQGG